MSTTIKKLVCMLFLIANYHVVFAANAESNHAVSLQKELAVLEKKSDGRIGVSAIDTGSNTHLQYRASERFPFCSTFKVMGVSAVLKQSMSDKNLLQQKISYQKNDIVAFSPITEKHIGEGMTISDLSAAAISYSDDTAINLLINKLGGPAAITKYARSIDDDTFRLDRIETELNTAVPGDPRDTTTPIAMEKSLQKLVLGNALGSSQRELLQTWMKGNTTGNARIRAAVPAGWIVADKTGTGDYGTTNDIAVIWPPHCAPIVAIIYFTQHQKDAKPQDKVIATVAHNLVEEFTKNDSCLQAKG